jgi:hypothetical protein
MRERKSAKSVDPSEEKERRRALRRVWRDLRIVCRS